MDQTFIWQILYIWVDSLIPGKKTVSFKGKCAADGHKVVLIVYVPLQVLVDVLHGPAVLAVSFVNRYSRPLVAQNLNTKTTAADPYTCEVTPLGPIGYKVNIWLFLEATFDFSIKSQFIVFS